MPYANAESLPPSGQRGPQLVKTQLQLNYETNGPVHASLMRGSETPASHFDCLRHTSEAGPARLHVALQFMGPI
jgi:hypothetical protein